MRIFSQTVVLATQKQNPFTQREFNHRTIITHSRYHNQFLSQCFLRKMEISTHFFNKTKFKETNNSQEINHKNLKMKITSTKTNYNNIPQKKWNNFDQPDKIYRPDIFESYLNSENRNNTTNTTTPNRNNNYQKRSKNYSQPPNRNNSQYSKTQNQNF